VTAISRGFGAIGTCGLIDRAGRRLATGSGLPPEQVQRLLQKRWQPVLGLTLRSPTLGLSGSGVIWLGANERALRERQS